MKNLSLLRGLTLAPLVMLLALGLAQAEVLDPKSDLPPNIHPAAVRVSAVNTPKGVD